MFDRIDDGVTYALLQTKPGGMSVGTVKKGLALRWLERDRPRHAWARAVWISRIVRHLWRQP